MAHGEDAWWDALVTAVATVGRVTDRHPHGLVVEVDRDDGPPQVVELDITPEEWEEMNAISWGVVAVAAEHVRQLVLSQPRAHRYLSYADYRLEPSDTDWVSG